MKNNSHKIKHSLRFSVLSRISGLILLLLLVLGGYQYNVIERNAVESSESDKSIASSYFSKVLVQALWEFDDKLVDELVAAQSNIESLTALSISSLSSSTPQLFARNEENIIIRMTKTLPSKETLSKSKTELRVLEINYGGENIGAITLYFDADYYQKLRRGELIGLLFQLFGLAVTLLISFHYFINRYVVSPISELYQSVESLADGKNLTFGLEKNLPDNEIKRLAQKYSDVIRQLNSHKEHLEELVASRTAGLKEANTKMKEEISSRIASEEAMEIAKTQAQKANQTKTVFLSHITHELRTPLNGILGYAQILAEKDLPNDEKEYTSHIQRCSTHLLELINNILDYNKIESCMLELNMVPTSLESLMNEIKTIVYPRCASKFLQLKIEVPENIPDNMLVDAGKLKQIMINLLANAIKFTDRGFVGLTIECLENNDFLFSVIDSGQGIPEKDQNKVFEAYQQSNSTDAKEASTGLGLSISKSFIEAMGGELKLESEVGEGSKFFFSLNLSPVQVEKKNKRKGKIKQLVGSEQFTILIVDDIADNLYILNKVLQNVGFNVVQALSAKLAYQAIEEKTPDLIFMDIQMPEIDGSEAAFEIKKQHPSIDIIALTANVYSEKNASLDDESFDDYIYKPIDRKIIYQLLLERLELTAEYC